MTRIFYILTLLIFSVTAQAQNQTDTQGRKQGPWTKLHPNGKIMYQGTFRDDKPVGLMKRYNTEGVLVSELLYNETSPEVKATFYYPDGRKAGEGTYRGQKREGKWLFYPSTEPQYVISEEYYHEDLLNGTCRKYHPDGTVAETVTWDGGKRTGEWIQYYPGGKVCLRGEYLDGKLEGPFSFYYPDGRLMFEGKYRNNLREGDWMSFNEDGTLKQVIEYRGGRPADPAMAEKETKFLDDMEKNKGKIKIPDINGEIIK